jgi:crotonobetainyl-CoA:carnitine CoA-transferase CaiB-like acyl-CoA transferase
VVVGPLQGLQVLDLTRFVSGSYATMMLASLGADVIKIETGEGDPYRTLGPHALEEETALFLSLNSGKRSLDVDFRSAEGRAIIEQLLARSDFFVENSRPGSLTAYGLDYESVHERHPSLIYGSISGYGEVGPEAQRGGFDLILQAESGLMSITGDEQVGPVKVGAPVLDIGSGLSCVAGLLAAHVERLKTGQGRLVSTSLFEFALASLSTVAAEYFASGSVPGLLGTHSPTFAPYGKFRTSDGWIVLAGAGSEDLWQRACVVLAREELIDDERFKDNTARVLHRDELTHELEIALVKEPTATWLERFATVGVPATEIRNVDQVLDGAQTDALGIVQRQPFPQSGTYRVLGAPVRFDHEALVAPGASPELGGDTIVVLEELGLTGEAIEDLRSRGVVGVRS